MKMKDIGPKTGADPGFLIGGGTNPQGGGVNIQICQIFPPNYMKIRKFWSIGGARGAPLGSATGK